MDLKDMFNGTISASFQGIKRLFVHACDATDDDEVDTKTIKSILFREQKLKVIKY